MNNRFLFCSRPPPDVLHERQGQDGDVGDLGAGADPLKGVRPRRARVPEGAGRHEEVSDSLGEVLEIQLVYLSKVV